MRNMLIFLACVAMVAARPGVALSQEEEPDIDALREENAQLKKEVESLKKQHSGAEGHGVKTFAIHENYDKWWSDPSAFTFELVLRDTLANFFPEEAADIWLARHKNFVGQEVNWSMRVLSVEAVDVATAGTRYYESMDVVAASEADVKDAKANTPRGRSREDRAEYKNDVRLAEEAHKQTVQESNQWKEFLDQQGGLIIQMAYPEGGSGEIQTSSSSRSRGGRSRGRSRGRSSRGRSSRGRSRGRGRSGAADVNKTIVVTLYVAGESGKKLEAYLKGKGAKYPNGGTDWPIAFAGTFTTFEYDGTTISIVGDGQWKPLPGGAKEEPHGISRRGRRGRSSGRSGGRTSRGGGDEDIWR